MEQPLLGQINLVGFNFAPRGWASCRGQLLDINSNTALFSLLGTTYGGDGRTSFGLPDLRGRVAIGDGQGPGLSNYYLGYRGGVERVTLNVAEMPSHSHQATITVGTGEPSASDYIQTPSTEKGTNTSAVTIENTGGNQSHENRQPYLVLNYVIALQGLFPSRP